MCVTEYQVPPIIAPAPADNNIPWDSPVWVCVLFWAVPAADVPLYLNSSEPDSLWSGYPSGCGQACTLFLLLQSKLNTGGLMESNERDLLERRIECELEEGRLRGQAA